MIDVQATPMAVVAPEDAAPVLPVEVPIINAAMTVYAAHQACAGLLYLIRNTPRNEEAIGRAFADAQAQLSDAWGSYEVYREIGTCRGRA